MSALASLHHPPSGTLSGNHWGPAVTVLETLVGSPYYFNFHYRDVGNFLVKGKMGSGKTALIGSLLLQSLKFGAKIVIFDRERGLEILVRALDGVYERLKPGLPTGLNPCQLDDTVENRKFLSILFRKILTPSDRPLDEAEGQVIEQAIEGMYRLDQADRQFSHIASLLGAARPGSLRARFDPWHSGREHAWLFDHPVDDFQYEAGMIGIDLTFILDDPIYKVPALMYLLHRFSEGMEGKRGLIFIDEGQKPLEDDYFREIINDLSRSPRKKDNLFGLATHAASDVDSPFYDSLRKAAACQVFFPDPSADRSTYIDKFGLTEREYEVIKTLSDEGHYCLLRYGYGKASVVVRACLDGMDDELAVISGRTENIQLMEKIRQEVGPEAKDWLPVFQARRRRESNI
jgi:type IV secretion system protein VirB4